MSTSAAVLFRFEYAVNYPALTVAKIKQKQKMKNHTSVLVGV